MNIMSNGSFLDEMSASNKQSELVKKLTAAWEKKNTKAARAGGASLMALSLAACGGDDDTPFSQADIDTALTDASGTAHADVDAAITSNDAVIAAAVDITTDNAAAVTAAMTDAAGVAHADVDAAIASNDAAVAAAVDITTDNAAAVAAALTDANGVVHADVDAAIASNDAAVALAVDLTTDNAAATDAAVAAASDFADLAALVAAYDNLVAPVTANAFTTATTDALRGGPGNDVFTAAAGTVTGNESVIDTSTTDADTLTIVSALAIPNTLTVTNIETVDITLNNLGAIAVNADLFSGVDTLTVSRGDVVVGGTTLTGNTLVDVQAVNAANVGTVVAGANTGALTVVQATTAGVTVNGDTATGAVNMTGAGTLNVGSAATTVALTALGTAAEDAKALTINADSAATSVTTAAGFTGAIAINAAAAATVDVDNATGGLTLNAATGAETLLGAAGIRVGNVDATGATITTGAYALNAAGAGNGLIEVEGTTAATDAVTVAGSGVITLNTASDGANTDQIETVNLSGNGADVTYTILGSATTITGSGANTVNLAGNEDVFAGATISGVGTIDLTAGTAGTIAGGNWSADKVDLGFDNAGNAITLADASTIEVTSDQAGMDINYAAGSAGNLTLVAGDDNGASAAVGTITLGALNLATGTATSAGTVTIEASTANVTATSTVLDAAQSLVITGDEDVNLGQVTAASLTANGSSGIITATSTTSATTMTTGGGADVLTVNGAAVHTISSGAGNDGITVTNSSATSTFDAGAGADTFTLDAATSVNAIVLIGGDGNDDLQTDQDIDGVYVGGEGTDTLTITGGTLNLSNNANFALSSVEAINLTNAAGVTTISAAQLANNGTFAITANGDQLTVDVTTTGGTLDASGITIATGSTATLNYVGSAGADVMTGGVAAETFNNDAGADSFEGGSTGVDTLVSTTGVTETGSANASTGMIVNMGATAVSAAAVIANSTQFLAGNQTSVAADSATHLYAANLTTNAAVVDAVSAIENITGTGGIDYIVGSAEDNVILGNGGADYIEGGAGSDTITGGAGIDTIDLGASDAVSDNVSYFGVVLAANANNVTSFEAGAGGDVVQFSDASLTAVAGGYTAGTALTVANVAGISDTASQLIVDTIANLGALGVTIGDQTGKTNINHQLAVASDTGAIFYDADGDWTGGSVQIGDLDVTTGLVAANFEIIA